ncbi:MAG: hypothetical protein A4E23_01564 [Methanomethylovorans sp. PtaU1.Bin073]|nr:MAG: hypothetical protein A4E23_01564 [Methanomethylovorans sp. PtaU1.Bin073]
MTSSGFCNRFSVIINEMTKEVKIAIMGMMAPPFGSFLPRKNVSTKASAGSTGIKNAMFSIAIFTTSIY